MSGIQSQDKRPKYSSRVRLSKGWLKIAAWSHDKIQLAHTIGVPTQDPAKFDYVDTFRWRIPAVDIPLVIAELKKAEEFCKSKFAEAPAPPPLRQLVFEKIPATGEILVSDLASLCVPSICNEAEFIEALAELHRLGLINRRVEGADTLFPRVFVSRMVVV